MDIDDWKLEAREPGCVEGRVSLPDVDSPVALRLDTDSGEPSSAQVRAVEEFLAGWEALRAALAPALFAYYRAAVLESYGPDVPDIATQDDVWPFVTFGELHVPRTSPDASRLVRVSGGCAWGEEHGLEIGVRNATELLYVGPFDGKGLREPRYESPANFADPVIQEAALAGTPIDEEAFDDARLAAAAEPPAAGDRPWWKFW